MANHVVPGEYMYENVLMMGCMIKNEVLDRLKNFELRKSDILLITYPKAGTTWLTEAIAKLMEDKIGTEGSIRDRMPFIEFTYQGKEPVMDAMAKQTGQRFITTHLMPSFFEKEIYDKKPKAIVLMRNPKDCINSYYHYYKANGGLGKFQGNFDDFWHLYETNKLAYGDPIKHIKEWYKFKSESNFLFITFEDMKLDSRKALQKIASHLECDLTEENLEKIVEHLSFDKMSKDTKVNKCNYSKEFHDSSISKYLRKGAVGDWVNSLNEGHSKEIDERIKNEITPLGLEFKFNLD